MWCQALALSAAGAESSSSTEVVCPILDMANTGPLGLAPLRAVRLSHLGAVEESPKSQMRSQFSSDPYFNGSLDDFRVYRRALSQKEITALVQLR